MNNRVFILIIVVLVFGALALIVFGGEDSTSTAEEPQRSSNTYGVSPSGVVLEEAYSFACPACGGAHTHLKTIREEYKDRVVFQPVHLPLTARPGFKNALIAHRAAEAAALQGDESFWALHDKLFEERDLWVELEGDPYPQIKLFVEEIGLNLEQFEADFKSEKVNGIIQADIDYLRKTKGIDSTPTFILNDEVIKIDWQDADNFRQVLDEALQLAEEEAGESSSPETTDEEAKEENTDDDSAESDSENEESE